MKRFPKILAATCAALALTASLALAAGNSNSKTATGEADTLGWQCPGLTGGAMGAGYHMGGYGHRGYDRDGRMGYGYGRMGYDRDGRHMMDYDRTVDPDSNS